MTEKEQKFKDFIKDFNEFKQAIDEFDTSNLDQNMCDEFLEVKHINIYIKNILNVIYIGLTPKEFINKPTKSEITNAITQLSNNQFNTNEQNSANKQIALTKLNNLLSTIKNIANTYLMQISSYVILKMPKAEIDKTFDEIIKNCENTASEFIKNVKDTKVELYLKSEEFNNLKEEQTKKIDELTNKSNKLFEHLTTANLAYEFENQGNKITKDIKKWDIIFLITLSCFVAFAVISFFTMKEMANYKDILTQLLINMSVYIPLSWLALFASRRRNEDKKLQEEYRYKETIATNYLNYKQNIIEDMPEEQQNELLKELMHNLLDMLKDNPNNKFVNNHNNENIPIIEFIDKISKMPSDNIEKILNFLKGNK